MNRSRHCVSLTGIPHPGTVAWGNPIAPEDRAVSIQVHCPHCSALGVVADDQLGVPIQCGTCKRSFWVKSPLAGLTRTTDLAAINGGSTATHFDVGGVTSAGR